MEPSNQMADESKPKWEGKAFVELSGPRAEQVWPLLEDFFGLNKWFPTLTTCLPVEGISGQPGCVRYCAGFKTPVNSGADTVNWTKQKLLSIDPIKRSFSYSIVDGNVGFNSYVSTVIVVPKEEGCEIEWCYEVEPVEGWKPEDLDSFIGSGLLVMARRMEEAILAGTENNENGTTTKLGHLRILWTPSPPADPGERITRWAVEKLVAVDRIDRSFGYEFVDNIGFSLFVAMMKSLSFKNPEAEGEIVWSLVVNPVKGWRLEDLVSLYDSARHGTARHSGQKKPFELPNKIEICLYHENFVSRCYLD